MKTMKMVVQKLVGLCSIATTLYGGSALSAPMVMHLDTAALKPLPFSFQHTTVGNGLSVDVGNPLQFPPRIRPPFVRFNTISPFTSQAAQFTIHANPGDSITVEIKPQASGFKLDGGSVPSGSEVPQITTTRMEVNGNTTNTGTITFSMIGDEQLLRIAGTAMYFSDSLAAAYISPPDLSIMVTDTTTSESLTRPLKMEFSILDNGQIQTVRNLNFPEQTMAGIQKFRTISSFDNPNSAKFTFSPANATFSVSSSSICLSKDGSSPTSCDCNNPSDGHVKVTFAAANTVKDTGNDTATTYLGGTACYPAELAAGNYHGTASAIITYF